MASLNVVTDAAKRGELPVALIIAQETSISSYHSSVLREFDVETLTAEAVLAEPAMLPACALLLADTSGLDAESAASLLAFAAARSRTGIEVILVCPEMHIDFLGPLVGSGARLLCAPRPEELDRALQDANHAIRRQLVRRKDAKRSEHNSPISVSACPWPTAQGPADPPSPYWLDILSDQLTDVAIARQAVAPESAAIATLLEQLIERLLLLIPDRALLDAIEASSPGSGTMEYARLVVELDRREQNRALSPGSPA